MNLKFNVSKISGSIMLLLASGMNLVLQEKSFMFVVYTTNQQIFFLTYPYSSFIQAQFIMLMAVSHLSIYWWISDKIFGFHLGPS